jgi:hypothetical protein
VASWVKGGGTLVYLGGDEDPFNAVREWWNTGENHYASPRQALFEALGVAKDAGNGTYKSGRGRIIYDTASPAALTYKADGADHVRDLVKRASEAARLPYAETNAFVLRRGPYVIASGLDESLPGEKTLRGRFVDLFDAGLPVLRSVTLAPNSRRYLLDLDRVGRRAPTVLAGACKALGEKRASDGGLRFYAEGPDKTEAAVRLLLTDAPKAVTVDGRPLPTDSISWDAGSRTALLRFPNSASGHWVSVR